MQLLKVVGCEIIGKTTTTKSSKKQKTIDENEKEMPDLIGMINVDSLIKFAEGDINHVPIKKPNKNGEWEVISWINRTKSETVFTVTEPMEE